MRSDVRSQAGSAPALPAAWWATAPHEILAWLSVDPDTGLTGERVEAQRQAYGRNALRGAGPTSPWLLLWAILRSPLILLLLAVAALSLLLAQFRQAIVMAFIVAAYIAIELVNKVRSDRTVARLRALQEPRVTVIRDGQRREIPVEDVVVGDILPLLAGSLVAADGRLLSSAGLLVNEGALTGEAAPVSKDAWAQVAADAPLAERPTAVFAGTTILDGEGRAVVVAVGPHTELGRVAGLSARQVTELTPLQKEMNDLARTLALVAVIVSLVIPLLGFLRGYDPQQMLLTWLSLTFLLVPGQPPIIIALVLALAAIELARRGVIVRRLQGAETLGSVTTILSDKTGTITQNRMALTALALGDGTVLPITQASGEGGELWAAFLSRALPAIPEDTRDPTDRALIEAARSLPVPRRETGRLVRLVGFARGKSYRTLEYQSDGQGTLYITGNPEHVLDHTDSYARGNATLAWGPAGRDRLMQRMQELAAQGKRITAYAYGATGSGDGRSAHLTLAGLAILDDPIRPEVRGAIAQLRRAGVRVIMVTGDNPATALFVGRQVGLKAERALTGAGIARLTDGELLAALRDVDILARTTPEDKLRLVRVMQESGQTVAVTGDGVNDAPALRTADIGIAMGLKGTDVAREAAGLVLTDDNLAHLPDGVAIGRKAYDNFRKGITYYLSAKAILLTIFVVPLAARAAFPLTPIQIIATELLMDLASSSIFVSESPEAGIMERGPRRQARFLSRQVGLRILRNLVGLAAAILVAYFVSLGLGYSYTSASTAAFATWLLGHILLAMNLKQERTPLLRQGLLANRFAAGWLAGMIALVIVMTTLPAVQAGLNTTALAPIQWVLVTAGAVLGSAWIEVLKWLQA